MSYFGQTLKYLKKTFWLPTVIMLIPSVIACLFYEPYREVAFVAAFDYEPYIGASKTFAVIFADWRYVWPAILVGVTQTVAAAVVMSAMDAHFRTGRLTLRHPWRLINYSVFPIAIGVILMSLASVVWRFLLFGLVTLVQTASLSFGFPSGVALAMIGAIAIGLFVLHVLMITPMLFWAPIMFVYGYRFRDAAATSFKLISGKKVFRTLLVPMLVCAGVQALMGFLRVHTAVACVVGFFVFLATNVYVVALVMLAFYDISGLERRDIKPYQAMPLPVVKKPEPPAVKEQPKAEVEQKKPDKPVKKQRSVKRAEPDAVDKAPPRASDIKKQPSKIQPKKAKDAPTAAAEQEANNGV